jgi:hypothetical protein
MWISDEFFSPLKLDGTDGFDSPLLFPDITQPSYLTWRYNMFRENKLPHAFPIQNYLKQGDISSPVLSNIALEFHR